MGVREKIIGLFLILLGAWPFLLKIKTIENTFEIIPNGKESAENFGMLKASLEKTGARLDDFDLTIASCALAHNLTLVTNDLKHFSRIESLKITNWSVYPEINE